MMESTEALIEPATTLSPTKIVVQDGLRMPKDQGLDVSAPSRLLSPTVIADARVRLGDAAVYRADGSVVDDTLYLRGYSAAEPMPEPIDITLEESGEAPYLIAHNAGYRNYYHFLLQSAFTAWMFARKFPAFSGRFVSPELGDDKLAILARCGLDLDRFIFLPREKVLSLGKVAVLGTAYTAYAYNTSVFMRDFASEIIANVALDDASGRKIYISRRDTRKRPIVNEAEVEAYLSENGYEVVIMTGMPFDEQVRLFRSASHIISPHGAGLSNIIFCQPGTALVELCHAGYRNSCFARVGQMMQLDYTTHIFHPPEPEDGVRRHGVGWTVDVPALARYL